MTRPLHHQLLFHWIGSDIDERFAKGAIKSKRERSEHYLEHLRGSLDRGIWVCRPRRPESIGGKAWSKQQTMPIACFTEWRLEDSAAHAKKYGHMAFGFSRSWVHKRGGQPVTYVHQADTSRFIRSVETVWKHVSDGPANVTAALEHILHFVKPVREAPSRKGEVQEPKLAVRKRKMTARDPYRRLFGASMPFVAEREWRIVADIQQTKASVSKSLVRCSDGTPDFSLPYTPGTDLFTLVVPDNLTMQMIMADRGLWNRLQQNDRPHVTLLSLEDIGTF